MSSLSPRECVHLTPLDHLDRLYQMRHWEPQLISINTQEVRLINHWTKGDHLLTFFPNQFPLELLINSFVLESKRRGISPALEFLCYFDPKTRMFEINGKSPYEDILVYGENVGEASDVLEKEILPILWEDCVRGEGIKLSPRAQEIKLDLEKRVIE